MAKYRTEKSGDSVTIWSDVDGIGLQFTEGALCQRDLSSIVATETATKKILSTTRGAKRLLKVQAQLIEYASKHYPIEFLSNTNNTFQL